MNLQRCADSSIDTKESVTDKVARSHPNVQGARKGLIVTNIFMNLIYIPSKSYFVSIFVK